LVAPRPLQKRRQGFGSALNNNPTAAQVTSNGFTDNGTFAADMGVFMEEEDIGDGVGPTYNARACVDCHATVNVGGTSQVTELRVAKPIASLA
jgi:CxxC motif-containing protein (DUF1111 family)